MSFSLSVSGLSVSVKDVRIVDDVALDLARGEILAVVGESGSGKTTLARAILGLVEAAAGRIGVQGQPPAALSKTRFRHLRGTVSLLFQNPAASFNPRMRIGAIIVEGQKRADAETLLAQVGLDAGFITRFPHQLSGGQARRVAVARALACEPAVIIADEPTAGLDVSVQGEILNLLLDLRESRGLSIVLITHNLPVVRHVSDRTAVLYLGRIVESADTAAFFRAPLHPYSKMLLDAEPSPDPRQRQAPPPPGDPPGLFARPEGCGFHPRCPRAAARCRSEMPVLRHIAPSRLVACHDPLWGMA